MNTPAAKTKPFKPSSNHDEGLVMLVETLMNINEDTPLAKLNETTISDNNGGRISL